MVSPGRQGVPCARGEGPRPGIWSGVPLGGVKRPTCGGERPHLLGKLAAPLYRFAGSFPELLGARGGKLTQGGQAYRVLRAEEVTLGGRRLWEQALWKGGKTMVETDLLEGAAGALPGKCGERGLPAGL